MTIFYSVLFSLDDPKKNEYIYCAMIMLNSLIKTGTLGPTDKFYLMVDFETAQVINKIPLFLKAELIFVPKPKTILEGMTYRYQLHKYLPIINKDCVYLDCDMICIKKSSFTIASNHIMVFPEGNANDSNYCGDNTLNNMWGFTSGFFAFNGVTTVFDFFDTLVDTIKSSTKIYYTLDQPYFNFHLDKYDFLVEIMPHNIVSFNGHTHKETAHFVNFCGDPGDGAFHFQKMLSMIL